MHERIVDVIHAIVQFFLQRNDRLAECRPMRAIAWPRMRQAPMIVDRFLARFDAFPRGCRVARGGKGVGEARKETIDDHWSLTHSRPGDGAHRPALGQPVIPLQEKLNDCMDYIHDAFMHLIPIKWVDPEAVDTEALQQIEIKPGLYLKMKRKADKALAE